MRLNDITGENFIKSMKQNSVMEFCSSKWNLNFILARFQPEQWGCMKLAGIIILGKVAFNSGNS